MNLYHIESGLLAQPCGLSIGFDNLIDQFSRHLLYLACRHGHLAWSIGNAAGIYVPSYAGESSVHAAMGELYISKSPGIMDRPRCFRHSLAYAECIQLKLLIMGLSRSRVHNRFSICNDSRAAHRLLFQVCDHLRRKVPIQINHAGTGRRADNSVLHSDIPHP